MATIGNAVLTLADHAKRLEPAQAKFAKIVEILSQENDILQDMVFKYGNLTTGHRTTIRTGLPQVFWRNYNMGVPTSKSQTATVDEKCGMLEAFSEVDVALAKLGGDPTEFRFTEAQSFIEAMGQECASTILYGNSALNPEEIDGLTLRYSSLSAPNARNIINGAGSVAAGQTSIWLVVHGDQTIHGIVPQGSTIGLDHIDHGMKVLDFGGAGLGTSRMTVYQDQFKWDVGIALKDWRYVVRICNIGVAALAAGGAGAPDLIELMIKALHRVESLLKGKACFYMNRTVAQYLDIQRHNTVGNAGMQYAEVDGKWIPSFRGVPIKRLDAILNTEAVVS
jgi:hypothetical protein